MLIVTAPSVRCLTFSANFSATPWIRWVVGTWCENTRLIGVVCAQLRRDSAVAPATAAPYLNRSRLDTAMAISPLACHREAMASFF
jgi:hypothetical protein